MQAILAAAVGLVLLAAREPARAGAPAGATPDSADALRRDATAKYRAKRYVDACKLFARAAGAAPEDAAIQADLGLCLGKLGKKEEAVAATQLAISLALRKESRGGDDVQVRKNAYYNLWTLEERVGPPEAGKCAPLPSPPGCARPLHACTYGWGFHGMRTETTGSSVRIATTSESAARDAEGEVPGTGANALPTDGVLERFGTGVEVLLSFEEELVSVGAHPEDWANWKPTSRSCDVIYANGCAGAIAVACGAGEKGRAEISEVRIASEH
jgi:hypothetical protein